MVHLVMIKYWIFYSACKGFVITFFFLIYEIDCNEKVLLMSEEWM